MTRVENLGAQAPLEALLDMVGDEECGGRSQDRALRILHRVSEWITPQRLLTAFSYRAEDELAALQVLEVLGKQAPIDLLRTVLDDEKRDQQVRLKARGLLHDAGFPVPLKYLLAEQNWWHISDGDRGMIETMNALGEQAPLQELLALLGHEIGWIQKTAIESLRKLVPYLPIERLLTALDENNLAMREGAARVLGAFAEQAPISKLISLFQNPAENYWVRLAVLYTLVELHMYIPVEAVIAMLHDEDTNISGEILWVLEKWGKNVPIEPLLTLLDDEKADLREDVIWALGALEDHAPIDLLLTLLESSDREDSSNAAKALGRLGKYAPLDALLAHLYDHNRDMRKDILQALKEMGAYAPMEIFLQALENEKSEIRFEAEHALYDLAEKAPEQLFALTCNDPRPIVRKVMLQAVEKLGQTAPLSAKEAALAALQDEDEEVRFYARRALISLEVDLAMIPMEPLLCELQDQDHGGYAYWTELDLLARFGSRIPVEALLPLFGNSNIDVCGHAAKTLSQTHPDIFQEVVQQAEAILRGGPTTGVFSARVQSRLADRIRRIERATPAVLDMVAGLLDWPYWEVRMKAAQALGAIHRNIPDRAIRRLLQLRHDPHSQAVRTAADEALAEILSRESGMEDE